jgi:hypothetical protein
LLQAGCWGLTDGVAHGENTPSRECRVFINLLKMRAPGQPSRKQFTQVVPLPIVVVSHPRSPTDAIK